MGDTVFKRKLFVGINARRSKQAPYERSVLTDDRLMHVGNETCVNQTVSALQ